MNFLNPSTYWVDDRCYRVLTHQTNQTNNAPYVEQDEYSDENSYTDEQENDAADEYNIEQGQNGKFRTAWHVPSAYYAYLIGSRGSTKKRIEQDTGCNVYIPPRGDDSDIAVVGRSYAKVRTCRLQVELLVDQARRKQRPTHFLSLPLYCQELGDNLTRFKAMVMGKCSGSRGVCEEVFQEPQRLHLTVGVMTLMDDGEKGAAVAAFEKAMADRENVCPAGGIKVQVQGLHYFNDDPAEVSVLYAGAKPVAEQQEGERQDGHQVQALADHLTNSMIKSGVMEKKFEHVRLHVTVLNTSFLKDAKQEDSGDIRKTSFEKETFDARGILKEFGDFEFGEATIDEVHLSVMHTRDSNSGYYTSVSVMKL